MQAADHTALMHMQDILTYTVFSGHHAFISMLIKTMTDNIAQEYASFPAVAEKFQTLERVLTNPEFGYHAKVVVFFFFLSIDYKVPASVFLRVLFCVVPCLTYRKSVSGFGGFRLGFVLWCARWVGSGLYQSASILYHLTTAAFQRIPI